MVGLHVVGEDRVVVRACAPQPVQNAVSQMDGVELGLPEREVEAARVMLLVEFQPASEFGVPNTGAGGRAPLLPGLSSSFLHAVKRSTIARKVSRRMVGRSERN